MLNSLTRSGAIEPAPVITALTPALMVWYDGGCPICLAEIGMMRRLDRDCAIAFVDVDASDACPIDRQARLERLHAQRRGGEILTGAPAFVAMWRVLPALRPLAVLASPPPVLWLLEHAYRVFLKVRPRLQVVVRWGLARQARANP